MKNGQDYKVLVKATYKDYLPLEFELNVRYLPNLDGQTKFVDLGTHIFFKSQAQRPVNNYKFLLHGVTDEKVDDDIDTYSFALSDTVQYYSLGGQENVIDVSDEEAKTVPHIGLNRAAVEDEDAVFHKSAVRFEALGGLQTDIEIPLVARLKDGELAVVLQWTQGSKVQGDKVAVHDLDLHVEF